MQLPDLSSKAIRAWVESLPADEPCGTTGNAQACVVAKYLKSRLSNTVAVYVDDDDIVIYDGGVPGMFATRHSFKTPRCVARIVSRFDCLGTLRPLPADVLPLFNRSWRPQS